MPAAVQRVSGSEAIYANTRVSGARTSWWGTLKIESRQCLSFFPVNHVVPTITRFPEQGSREVCFLLLRLLLRCLFWDSPMGTFDGSPRPSERHKAQLGDSTAQ